MDYDRAIELFEPVLGFEVHVELNTKTKMFSDAPNFFGGEPNTNVTPVDLGLPGSLPVVNEHELPPDERLHQTKLTFDQLAALDADFESGDGVFVELKDVPDAQVTPGMRVLVQSDDRFYTSPCGNVGFDNKLEGDLAALRERYGATEQIDDGARTLITIRGIELPAHWNRTTTDILVHVPQGYPLSAMDMFWVTPGLALADGRVPQNGDLIETYGGHAWQRFSWHYPPGHKWNAATDGLLTHMRFARVRLGQAH